MLAECCFRFVLLLPKLWAGDALFLSWEVTLAASAALCRLGLSFCFPTLGGLDLRALSSLVVPCGGPGGRPLPLIGKGLGFMLLFPSSRA